MRGRICTLGAFGPEHEFSIVDNELKTLPISDEVLRKLHGRLVNKTTINGCEVGKELQGHVLEIKGRHPFSDPVVFEEVIHNGITELLVFLEERFKAKLLGSGMHPFLRLEESKVWSHRGYKIYDALDRAFDISQHGWLNIQSFQLNLPYDKKSDGVRLYNCVSSFLPYLVAISAASPIFDSQFGKAVDNRLIFYRLAQQEASSILGNIVPEYIGSVEQYLVLLQRCYSDLARMGVPELMREWVNSRGVIFRFKRKCLEIRIMDEQECIKSDVALSCFIRSLARGLMEQPIPVPNRILVHDLESIIKDGLAAEVKHPFAKTAREVCNCLLEIARRNATPEEHPFLEIVDRRIQFGNLAELIRRSVIKKARRTNSIEAMRSVYHRLVECLCDNEPFGL